MLLGQGVVRRAVAVESAPQFPWARSASVLTTGDVSRCAGSKYTLIHHPAALIAGGDAAVVTLPCQSVRARDQGARLVVGLFCGLNIAPAGYQRVLRAHGVRAEEVTECEFRAPGGGLHVRLADGREVRVPRYFWLSYFYPYSMCVDCRDYLNHNADIAVGDRRKDWNSVVAWTETGQRTLLAANDAGAVTARELAPDVFQSSLMTPYFQKEVRGGYGRHALIRYRRVVRKLPYPMLERLGERFYRRTVAEFRSRRQNAA
jgi:coenzyme F420-reducing hydrogenase beta subunit